MDEREGRRAMDLLAENLPAGATVSVDAPLREDGVWWADVTINGVYDVVGWFPGRGYAMSSTPDTHYGENPDIWVPDADAAAARFAGILAMRTVGPGPSATA